MNWEIYENGELVNTIYGGEDFVKSYCEDNGYTYELREDDPAPAPTTEERLAAMEQAFLAFMMEG